MSDWPEIWWGAYWSHFKTSISSNLEIMILGSSAIGRPNLESGQMLSKWPEAWRVAFLEVSWNYPCTLFDEWWPLWFSPLRGLILLFDGWWGVKRCRFDLKFDIEPFGNILRLCIGSNRRPNVFGAVVAERADFATAVSFLGKRYRNGLKLDVEPSSGILRLTISFVSWVRVSAFTAIWSSGSAVGRVKLSRII